MRLKEIDKNKLVFLTRIFFILLTFSFFYSIVFSINDFKAENYAVGYNIQADECFTLEDKEKVCYNTFKVLGSYDSQIPIIIGVVNQNSNRSNLDYVKIVLEKKFVG